MRFKQTACYVFILTMICGTLLSSAKAQAPGSEVDPYGRWVNGISEPWFFSDSISKEDIAAAQSRWAAIADENTRGSGNAWAGNYFIGGDTHGRFLRWSSQKGFVLFHVDKCAAQVMSLSYGRAVVSSDLIELIPENTATSGSKHAHQISTLVFLPVSWRNERLLVPRDEIADFGDYVAGLGKYNDANLVLLEYAAFFSGGTIEANPKKSAQRKPIVPPGYERFMKEPIDARIVSRGKSYVRRDPENEWWDRLTIPVTINAGSARGVKEKMVLRIIDGPGELGSDGVVTITKASLKYSQGLINLPVRKKPCVKFSDDDDCKDTEFAPVKIGLKVTTNIFLDDSGQQ